MKTLSCLLIIITLISCRQSNNNSSSAFHFAPISNNISILTKTVVLDSALSKDLTKCNDNPEEVNSLSSCIIRKGDKQFIRQHTLLLDKSGKIISLYNYLPEGPAIIPVTDLQKDTALISEYDLSLTNNIRFDKLINAIIDNSDTLPIVDHWAAAKMLFVATPAAYVAKRQVIVYGYETAQ